MRRVLWLLKLEKNVNKNVKGIFVGPQFSFWLESMKVNKRNIDQKYRIFRHSGPQTVNSTLFLVIFLKTFFETYAVPSGEIVEQ